MCIHGYVFAYPLPLTNCVRLKVIPIASVRALNHLVCMYKAKMIAGYITIVYGLYLMWQFFAYKFQ